MEIDTETILIVEDEPAIALMEQKKLEEEGFRVEVAKTGKAALERLEKGGVDMLFLDHQLPDMSGSDVVQAIQEQVHTLPIVMITAHGDERLAVEMLKSGVADYLVKDTDLNFINSLPKTVRTHIEHFRLTAINNELQNELQNREEIFRNTFETIPDPSYLWERRPDGQIVLLQCNKACANLFKCNQNELFGSNLEEMFGKDHAVVSNIKHVFNKGNLKHEDKLIKLPLTGEEKWFDIEYVKFKEEGVLVITKDITDRKRAEDKIKELNTSPLCL